MRAAMRLAVRHGGRCTEHAVGYISFPATVGRRPPSIPGGIMRRFASRLFACCALASTLLAVSPVARATDYADLWWVPTESGWGMQTAQQGNLLFITLYVYDTNRYPT